MASLAFQSIAAPAAGIREFSLECPDRGFTFLLAPPEAGGPALLRLAAGLEHPAKGEVRVGDIAVHSQPPHRRDLTLATPSAPLLPHRTAGENLQAALLSRRLDRDVVKRRIRETATLLGLDSLLDRRPADLTVVDRRRFEIARALVPQPKVVLLDQPLSGLDEPARGHLRADLARVHQQLRATIVATTDDPGEALTLATHLVLLRHGAIVQQGAPLDVHRQPLNVCAAACLGRPGMNFLRGALKATDGRLTFKESDGGAVELRLDDHHAAASAYAGRDVLLGVRPEDCPPVADETPNAPGIFQALVDFVEIREGASFFHAQTGAHALISRSPVLVDPRESGRRGRFRLDPARVHLFDPATTQRIA